MGNLVAHFAAPPASVSPAPTVLSPSAASLSHLALGTPRRPSSPAGRRHRPARPARWDPATRTAPPSSSAASRRPSPLARRLFSPSGSGQSGQSSFEESPNCTIAWDSLVEARGEFSPTSPWTRSLCSSMTPSPICSPLDQESGPYGRNAYFANSPGPYTSTPQR